MDPRETQRDLRKKLKRMTESRDLQVAKNKEKSVQLKAMRGAVDDLTASRDGWKEKKIKLEEEYGNKLKELEKELEKKNRLISELNEIIKKSDNLILEEKQEKEHDASVLHQQIEELKKKYRTVND